MEKSKLYTMYVTENRSQRSIAKELGVSQTTVRYFLKKYDIVKNQDNSFSVNKDKICPKCAIFKTHDEFYHSRKNNQIKSGSWCKVCMTQQVVDRQRRYKQQALDYKGSKCQRCGYMKYQGALEFHHLDPSEKDFQLSSFSRNPLTDICKAELDKCILLCSNCHREEHFNSSTN